MKKYESSFEAKLSLKEKINKSKANQLGSKEESEESSNSDLEVVDALLAKKYSKGRGKYKGKNPLIYFSCELIGHIATKCPNRENKDKKKINKYKGKKEFKNYKEKGKKCYLMAKDSNKNEDDMVYIDVKDESNDEGDKMALISYVKKNDTLLTVDCHII